MKTLGKIIICIIVILCAVGIAYLVYNGDEKETNNNTLTNTNTSSNVNNNLENNVSNKLDEENKDYIGDEENKEEPKEEKEQKQEEMIELTGKDKAIDVVKSKYALDGQTVRFDHMEGSDYIIKLNDGTAVTWYLVNGTTWEAEEY